MGKLELGELQITSLNDIERFDVPLSTIFPEADPNEIKNITWIGPEILSSGLLHPVSYTHLTLPTNREV